MPPAAARGRGRVTRLGRTRVQRGVSLHAARNDMSFAPQSRRFLEPDGIAPGFAPGMVTNDDACVGAGPGTEIEGGLGHALLPDGFVFCGSANEEDAVDG